MSDILKRCTPEEALEKIRKENRGQLKIFLGYAPGVGKTYKMLNEANRRLIRGVDVVIGNIETHKRTDTINEIKSLPIIPTKKIIYNGTEFFEMNVEAIIKRKPNIVLIDELAHTNVIGSKNIKRYEDVEEILAHGISVITTLNIEHIESLNLEIRRITGVKVSETIPDSIIENADEVVVIDISPSELQKRLKNGTIYVNESASHAIKNFFRINSLNALRELALRLTAEGVDEKLAIYMREHGIHDNWHTVERVMVCISSNVNGKRLIRKGVKIASKFKCECYVVNVNRTSIFSRKSNLMNKKMIINHQRLAKQLGAEIFTLESKSIFKALSDFAIEKHITQIVAGSSRKTKTQYFFTGSTITKLVKYTKNVEFHIVPSD